MTENQALESELAREAFDRLLNPTSIPRTYEIVPVETAKYKDIPIQTYALGFKKSEHNIEKGRKVLIRAVQGIVEQFAVWDESIRGRKQTLLAIGDILMYYDFDTLAFRGLEYKIEEDQESLTLRCAFIKDGKEAKPID